MSEQQFAKLNEQLILARAETAQAKVKYDQVKEVTGRGGDASSFADGLQSGVLGSLARQGVGGTAGAWPNSPRNMARVILRW